MARITTTMDEREKMADRLSATIQGPRRLGVLRHVSLDDGMYRPGDAGYIIRETPFHYRIAFSATGPRYWVVKEQFQEDPCGFAIHLKGLAIVDDNARMRETFPAPISLCE